MSWYRLGACISSLPITGGTILGSLTVDGGLLVNGAGPHAIGIAADTDFQVLFGGTFTASGGVSSPAAIRLVSTLPVPATFSGYGIDVAPTLNEAGSGTHDDFVSLHVRPPTIGVGVATLTNASTLKITSAPTGGTNNYALWSVSGNVRHGSLAGTGSRTVVADANGVLSAP